MNNTVRLLSFAGTVSILLGAVADAATYTYNLSPADINTGGILTAGTAGTESAPIAYDQAPSGYGNGAFITDIDGTNEKYSQLYINLQAAFQTTNKITIGQLTGITYYTKQQTTNPLDWALRIYTEKAGGATAFYQYRFDGQNPASGNNDWNLASAGSAGWFTNISDRSNAGNTNLGISQNLTQLAGTEPYSSANISLFSLFTGATGNTGALANGLDGVVISLSTGDQVVLNFVPEPGVAGLMAISGLCLLRRSRRTKVAHVTC